MNIYLISLFIVLLQLFQDIIAFAVKDAQACFGVLDELPSNTVINIYFMKFNEVAHTHPAADILTCFLHASHPYSYDKSITEQYFDVYKKCDYFKETNLDPFGKQQLEELVQLGLPYYNLETELLKKMKTGSKKALQEGIIHIQAVMSNEIELSSEYKYYKKSILRKIKPNHNSKCSSLNDINM